MVLAVLEFEVTDADGFLAAVGQSGELFQGVDGLNGFELRRGVEEPDRFLMTADWDSVEQHQAWQAAHAPEFLSRLQPFISGLPTIRHFA